MTKLEECPYCGEETDLIVWGDHGMGRVYKFVSCECCFSQGPRVTMNPGEQIEKTEERAREAWNDRVRAVA